MPVSLGRGGVLGLVHLAPDQEGQPLAGPAAQFLLVCLGARSVVAVSAAAVSVAMVDIQSKW
jgi:hypothetical protein